MYRKCAVVNGSRAVMYRSRAVVNASRVVVNQNGETISYRDFSLIFRCVIASFWMLQYNDKYYYYYDL